MKTKLNCIYSHLLQDTITKSIISETGNKIDTEIASLKTLMESNKLETIRYLAGKAVLFDYQTCQLLPPKVTMASKEGKMEVSFIA